MNEWQKESIEVSLEANERLMKERDELLEALESMVEMVEMNGFGKAYVMYNARVAIAKVRGRG
jgi:RNA-binding protein YhbY